MCISYGKVLTLAFRFFALFALCNECFPPNELFTAHFLVSTLPTMHCNSLRTARFVVLEHFVFTITTVVSDPGVFQLTNCVFVFIMFFLFVFVFSD